VNHPHESPQPLPTPNDHVDITDLVIEDLKGRRRKGIETYGTTLQPFNGRDALLDLYQELLDGAQYVRQRMEEDRAITSEYEAELQFRSDMSVQLIDSMASDASVISSARVSTRGDQSLLVARELAEGSPESGLIRYLMRHHHGTPFEHNSMTFFVQAPIFVFRELMRHRIASYNEESARYRELQPVFYLPAEDRKLVQVGKAGHYQFEQGNADQAALVVAAGKRIARMAYTAYRQQLEAGVAREVARMVLPVNIYSSAYVTMNARALMNFLSLRTTDDTAMFPSFPQREIEMVAEAMEQEWAKLMPLTHAAFQGNGRVAP
jgi:thymidylate synthase (FAD)